MIAAPLVVPEVITGLSLLMLFVALWQLLTADRLALRARHDVTITLAHITFSTAYVAVVIESRLTQL